MFDNNIVETLYVEKLYTFFLQTVNRYHNIERKSVFCRYLNINPSASGYDLNSAGTFDRYNSGVQYDLYEYTPLYYSSQVVNESTDVSDMKGQMFQGSLSVITYTIKTPHIEDLIIFNRAPQIGTEIFRVDHIRASINAMDSTPNVNWFELTLEYAPLVEFNKLNILNKYAYTMPMQKYISISDFSRLVNDTTRFVEIWKQFITESYDKNSELYTYTYNGNVYAPLAENQIIYKFLATKNEFQDHFNNVPRPYGVKYLGESGFYNLSNKTISTDVPLPMCNFSNTIIDQSNPVNIFEIVHLIRLWVWERQRDKFYEYKTPESPLYPILSEKKLGLNEQNTKCRSGIGLTVDVNSLPKQIIKG